MRDKYLILTVFAFCCFCLTLLGCQEQAKTVSDVESESVAKAKTVEQVKKEPVAAIKGLAPELTFETLVHDFGDVGPKTRHNCTLKFTNTGNAPLKINKKIKSTCGCTVPNLTKYDYAPGESGTLKVKFRASSKPGAQAKRLYVKSNDPKNKKIALTIKANIVLKVQYSPKKLKFSFRQENADYPEITLKSLDNKPFSITSFKSSSNCVTADFDPTQRATNFSLQPKVDLKKLRNTPKGRITITLTHPECKTISINFETLMEFKTTPALINIHQAKPAEPVIRELWVLNNYGNEFEIESTSSKEGLVKVLEQEDVKNDEGIVTRCRLKLEITPPAGDGKKRFFREVFFINIKGGEKIKVNCNGFFSRGNTDSADDRNLPAR